MTIQQFIEKAIEAGYTCPENCSVWIKTDGTTNGVMHVAHLAAILSDVLLDPLAWKAVGKVEGWGVHVIAMAVIETGNTNVGSVPTWKRNMHAMIDALADGKTIEEFISTL